MFTLFSPDGIYGTGKQVFASSRHVLVVEDNVAIADIICQTLKLAGYLTRKRMEQSSYITCEWSGVLHHQLSC
ncbi:MAG: response regulator [Chloroflexi bacterium]|nr:MAG: response regulator [Chloroflexota bacterium]